MSISNPKSSRVLNLYSDFLSGKVIKKTERAFLYDVDERSIQRDIDTIRSFLCEQRQENGLIQTIEYDRKEEGYRLVTQHLKYLSKGELLSICKILISSRAYTKVDLKSIVDRLLSLNILAKDKQEIEETISNELFAYADPAHLRFDPDFLWRVTEAIQTQHKIEITYSRLKEPKTVVRLVEPVGILFSEYYFYLMAVICDDAERGHFDNHNDPFPTIYRLDRIENLSISSETYTVKYSERFKGGEYKKRVQYMYGGKTQNITFRYTGPSIEAVLDKLPLSKVEKDGEGHYIVRSEVFGTGIKMWLLSQGRNIQLLSPQKLVDELSEEVAIMSDLYSKPPL